jgi:hypothetical protein
MIAETTPSQKIASKMLARYGIAFIWEAYVAAAAAHGLGKLSVARDLTQIAEAAEREWISATGASVREWSDG